ncbi:cytochrome c biogenesis protein CcdA [Thalassobaculum sp.]|uniref:cytochrome c biogenesis CcdA family protein n=1 Tax=Thalassobaculum sp. TaxID=2022740 RepID=UPI0032EF8760
MAEISNIGLLTAFLAGMVSFLSPCVLPLVPGYVSYIAGGTATRHNAERDRASLRLPAIGLGSCFVLGFSTVFVAFGASATALGQLLLAYRYELNIVGGSVVIVFGLFLIGAVRPGWMMRDIRFHTVKPGGRATSAYMLGLAFAFGWTPCIGPILGAILTIGAASATVMDGVTLLSVYALGLGVPFLLAAAFTDQFALRLRSLKRPGRVLQILAGLIMVIMGLAMITDQLSTFSYWLIEAFPVLATIG